MAHQLVFSSETAKPRTYPVTGEGISIGRHPENTVVLDHVSVSIYHAKVVIENGRTLLRDLQSSNGTKVNGRHVSEITLAEGDEIRFGPIVCHFRGEIWFKESADAPKGGASRNTPAKKISETQKPAKAAVAKEQVPKDKDRKNIATEDKPPQGASTNVEHQDEAEPPLTGLEKLRRRLTESRYFMLSLILHSVIVILAGSLVLYKAARDPLEFTAAGGDGLISSTDDLAPPPESPADSVPTEKVVQQTPNTNAPHVDVITTSTPASNFKVAMPAVQVKITTNAASLVRAAAGTSRGFSASMPGTMGGRVGSARARAMALNKMKPKSEEAVLRGLAWLAQNQNADGSWGDEYKGAMTGFGLLCFLGHGELQDSPQFGKTVGNALIWIFANGTKNEGRLNMAGSFNQPGVYEHAICTYALGEYYTMTRDQRVGALFKKAIGHILEGQGPGGGWMYAYDKSEDDLSVSGWQIQALKAAHLSKLPMPGVDKALDNAMAYIERVRGPRGGYGYRRRSDDYSLTGVGILCQLFWRPDRATLSKGMEWLLDETEKSKPVKYKTDSADLYAWYYHTQACLMFGGEAWTKWNGWFQDEICDVQNPDGSWPVPGGRNVGPQGGENKTGEVYRTSLCILMLEVFYRYMPTTQG